MTQRVFDIENEKDMQDLWDILPDWAEKIKKSSQTYNYDMILSGNENYAKEACIFKINWHDKKENAQLKELLEKWLPEFDCYHDTLTSQFCKEARQVLGEEE